MICLSWVREHMTKLQGEVHILRGAIAEKDAQIAALLVELGRRSR